MDHTSIRESALEALDAIAQSMGLDLDLADAMRALAEAERAIPGTWQETWADRLERAGAAMGLRIERSDQPAQEILTRSYPLTPLLAFLERDDGPRWILVTASKAGQVRYAIFNEPSQRERPSPRWASADEIERRLGPDADRVRWAMVQPLTPLEGMRGGRFEQEVAVPLKPLSRLIALLKPERQDLVAIVVFTIVIALLSLATPVAVERLVVTVSLGTTYQQVVSLSVMLFLALVFSMIFRVIAYYVMEIIQRRIYVRIVSDISFRLPRARLEAFDRQHGPELVNRFFEFAQIQKLSSILFLDLLSLIIQALVGMIVLAFYHPFLLIFDVVVIILGFWVVFVSGRGAIATVIQESHAKYESADWLEELARNPIAFRNRSGPELARERADSVARHWLRARRFHFQIVFNQVINANILAVTAITGMLALGGWLVMSGQMTLGQLVAAELIVAVGTSSLISLAKHFEGFYDLMAAMEKLGYLTDLPLHNEHGEQHRVDPDRGAAIELHEVAYDYHNHDAHGRDDQIHDGHHLALAELDLEINPGERLALIGPDASGRSTLVEILAGLRDPSTGRILYDGADYHDIHARQRREEVQLVRHVEVFHGSLVENVRMGCETLSFDDVQDVLDRVGLLRELEAFPRGMQTELTSGGAPLSDGQARRLTLARALASSPRLLIIDQTLDALDPGVRAKVLDAVFDPQAPWTLVVVTQSADIVDRCQRIVTLKPPSTPEAPLVRPIPPDSFAPPEDHDDDRDRDDHRPWYMNLRTTPPEIPPRQQVLPALRLVQSMGPLRRLSKVLVVLLLLAPIAMAFVPWRQNIPGQGRVVAFNPQDRRQPIRATIDGRVMRWWVVEGSQVKRGDRIVELEDNDPAYLERLELLLDAARERVRATDAKRVAFEEVVTALTETRTRAIAAAQKQLDIAIQNVEIARQNLQASEARVRATAPDYERKRRGAAEGLVSIQDFQFAEKAYAEARADLAANEAEVSAANEQVAARSAELDRVRAEMQSRIDSARADLETAQNDLAEAQQGVTNAEVDLARQSRRLVLAPRDGTIFRILTGQDTDIVKMGDPLALLVPDYPDPMSRTVELYVNGRDMPLIEPGREVRLQFEGWPAVQFIGWPSVAVGTFPGRVILVDPTEDGSGRFRVLVGPPLGQPEAWPSERFLRQGVQVQGWVLLRHVTLGYEIWRLINGFPPYVAIDEPVTAS
ncbi:ATP-binding cassette domain-containing protein [Tautonia rosea]|uniref:ATP-binding cassette domain-containing protein n=1 Tax=Tautonia rosea TaxID=2728037 RepID=UPI0014736513|nr:ATP-binding cassette domain-containing protein [Tautonia rosea]